MQRRMTRVYVISTHEQEAPLVCALQKLGVLHIEPVSLPHSSTPRDFSLEHHELEGLLLRVKGLRDLLAEVGVRPQPSSAAIDLSNPRTVELVGHLEEQVRPRIVERRQVSERLDAATHLQDVISVTEGLLQELAPLAGRELIVGLGSTEVPAEEVTQFLHTQLSGRCDVRWRVLPDRRLELAVRVDTEYAPAVKEYLEAKGVRPLALPAHIPSALTLPQALAQLRHDLRESPARLHQIDSQLQALGRQHGSWLLALERTVENRLAQLNAMIQFGYTDYTVLITGWIPHDEYAQFAHLLRERFAGIVVREDSSSAPPEEIPVALKNNSWSRPYELFLSIMGVPKYGTIDPVPVVSFFFPLFFGIIIGDVGYGLVIGALALWLRRRFAQSTLAQQAGQIAMHCALSTVFFGLIFAEFFGFILPYPHFKRGEQTNELLLFCVALGATQILLGFLLGAINALRERHGKHALAKVAAMAALIGLGLTVGVFAGGLPESLKTPSFVLLAAALVMLVISEGIIGILELVSYVGNIISYARLMGFGLVGLKIAELINEAGEALHNVFLAVIIGGVAHSANLGLALFESTVQSARLHYVEFFQKFLEMGGRRYEPFREKSIP